MTDKQLKTVVVDVQSIPAWQQINSTLQNAIMLTEYALEKGWSKEEFDRVIQLLYSTIVKDKA